MMEYKFQPTEESEYHLLEIHSYLCKKYKTDSITITDCVLYALESAKDSIREKSEDK